MRMKSPAVHATAREKRCVGRAAEPPTRSLCTVQARRWSVAKSSRSARAHDARAGRATLPRARRRLRSLRDVTALVDENRPPKLDHHGAILLVSRGLDLDES